MKLLKYVYIAIVSLLLGSCGKIDLIDDKSPSKPDGEDHGEGMIPSPEATDSCYTVTELAGVADNTIVMVGGYIVGYIPSGSISKTQFTADGAVESNIVIADDCLETDYKKCAPMQLVKGTEARVDENLCEHPENLGQFVVLLGVKNKYYYAAGLKPVQDYMFADIDDGRPEVPDKPEPDTQPVVYPILGKSTPRVMEGR